MKLFLKSNSFALLVLIGLSFLIIGLTDHFVLNIGFFESNGEILSGLPGQGAETYTQLQKWIYIADAIYLIIKLTVISLILSTALYMNDLAVPFRKILRLVILADYIFLLPALIKICWFRYSLTGNDLSAWANFYPLSLLSAFGQVSTCWHYLLQTLNIFEVAYWFLLAWGLKDLTSLGFDHALKIVSISYLPALLIWIATVTFCSLLLFPGTS